MSSILFLGNVRVLLGVHTSQLKTYTLFKADFNIFSVFLWPCYYWSTPLPVHIKFKWLMRNASPRLPVVNKLILCSSGGFFFLIKSDFKFKIERKTPLSLIMGIMGSSQFETWKMGTAEVRISQLLGFWPVLTSPTAYWKYNIEYTFSGKHYKHQKQRNNLKRINWLTSLDLTAYYE